MLDAFRPVMEFDQPSVRFGPFEIDLRSRELRKNGVRVRLQDQPFQILATLLAHPGDIVTREEFRVRLWPDGTFVDFEHSLNAAVKRLRVALGDTAEDPQFIETLPRRGYRFVAAVSRTNRPRSAPPSGDDRDRRPRLVVLPFANLSDVDQDYFTEGLTEELIAQLGRRCANRIGVLALYTSSVFADAAPRTAAEALRADYIVEGSVRRDGDRVRITARLVETGERTQLWADTYDRRLEDCLSVQADVVAQIAHALTLELLPPPSPDRTGTHSLAAYQAFLRGRYYWNKVGAEGLDEAIRYYDQAISLDSDFGQAYSARARAEVARCENYLANFLDVKARIAGDAGRALDIDETDSEAMVALAEFHRMNWEWNEADRMYRAAMQANPNSEATHRYYALFLAARRERQALRIVDRGWDLDPLCLVNNTAAASVRYFAGDYEAAVERCRHTLDIDPAYGPARRRMASALAELGRYDDAIEEYNLVAAGRLDAMSRAWLGHALAAAGHTAAARAVAGSLEQAVDGQPVPPFHLAILYAGLGDGTRAFAALELACQVRDPWLSTIDVEPRFRTLRDDPRYARLVQRLRLSSLFATV